MKNSMLYKVMGLLFVSSLFSCDDRFDFVNEINDPPEIYFVGSEAEQITDTVKVSLKNGQDSYSFSIRYLDISGGRVSSISASVSSGTLQQGNETINGSLNLSELSDKEGQIGLTFFHDGSGINKTYELEFVVVDQNGASDRIRLILLAINNIVPVASFVYSKVATTSVFEYELDASASFDPDDYLGGGIQVYKWTINGTNSFFTRDAIIKHTFAGAAGYEVALTVYDNDGEASLVSKKVIAVTN